MQPPDEPVTVRRGRGATDAALGRDVVLAVSAATGFPDPAVWPPDLLGPRTTGRQHAAESVWLAFAGARCIGHALVEQVGPGEPLAGMPELAAAAHTGTLFSLGGLAVVPSWQRLGIARRLRDARLTHLAETRPAAVVVTEVWPDAVTAAWYARHWRPLGSLRGHRDLRVLVFARP